MDGIQLATNTLLTKMLGSNNPITEYYDGLPCMLGEAVVRIVGESGEGMYGVINGVKMYSIPLVATPHGTIIKTGVLKLSKITKEGLELLKKYEKEVLENGDKLYDGRLENVDYSKD